MAKILDEINRKEYKVKYMKAFIVPLLILIVVLFSDYVMACPGCAGSMDNPKDARLVWILVIFIGLIYIPFFILYKTIYKYRKNSKVAIANEEE
ncbi:MULTISPECIES: hypothetical protein [Halobacteriovorax]|uniref:Uncharacterized protein n=1 Tax=Halobacteriovorax vibrionivorans TaxID=2152716 RepID=A0ABY0IJY3_9BACT|nr:MULTISPECIES: hypothetical protein [Halobacteriovorax]RZF23261.1 hypothetical protein DAY19_05695 [Halobacteriovorax vibrionivorans]TGD46114.1 hypothetical protein EP118_13380 [Halobacteriovorax sp. Y22]